MIRVSMYIKVQAVQPACQLHSYMYKCKCPPIGVILWAPLVTYMMISIEVGSRGFINNQVFNDLRNLTLASDKEIKGLKSDCIKSAISGSYNIFRQRNHIN